jgi:lysylphosphatidylglycerol synthetase-like protein (DUF2156 family)
MSALLYFFRGLALIWYAFSPSYRQRTNARWKVTRLPGLIAEIGTGIIGLILVLWQHGLYTPMSYRWIAEHLRMGTGGYVLINWPD